jgi:hypothetical protein
MRAALPLLIIAAATIACGTGKPKAGEAVVAAPTSAPATAPAQANGLTGTLLERIDASPYSYLRLKTAQGEVWAAVPEAKVEKGTEVTVVSPMLMNQFESKTLKRTFAEIYFGTLGTPGAAAPAPGANPHGQMASEAATIEVGKVEKATGVDARTIAEVWAQKGALKEKSVVVRGKVVKYNAGIMGKNWMHLQDGTGDPKKGTHDITVTSQDPAAKGDVVTVKGTVRLNKDFGAGYTYEAIIEDAKVTKK